MKKLLLLASAMLAVSAMAEDPYIESLGTSGISTGYRMKGGISRVEVDYALTDLNAYSTRIFGDTTGEKTVATMFYYTSAAYKGCYTFRINANGKAHDVQWSDEDGNSTKAIDLDRHTLAVDLKNGRCQIITGTSVDTKNFTAYSTYASDFAGLVADLPLSLFANYNNASAATFDNSSKAKIYGVKIYENDELVCDFVPCLKDGVTPCFKDIVNGNFIIGDSDSFRAGGDGILVCQGDGYVSTVSETPGEYLYIDTGYQVKNTTRVELDCALASNMVGSVLWSLFDAYPTARFRFAYNANLLYWVGSAASATIFDNAAFPKPSAVKEVRRTFILDIPNMAATVVTAGFTNRSVTVSGTTPTYSTGHTLKLACAYGTTWGIASSGLAPLKIYGLKIYENGSLVRNFSPYVKYDDATGTETAGLLDSKTGNFVSGYAKSDSTSGTATSLPYGGTITGDDQDAYVESDGTTGMNTGYKMRGEISRVELDFRLVTTNASAQWRIYGATAVENKLITALYLSGAAENNAAGANFYFRNGTSTYDKNWSGMDTDRHIAGTDLHNHKYIFTGRSPESQSFSANFSGLEAALPLSIYGSFASADLSSYLNGTGKWDARCAKARIYSVRFYENYVEGGDNTPVRELIPYSRGGVVGFYDTVTGEIVKNDSAAAGAFTFGGAGTDHGSLNCYIKPGYDDRLDHGDTTTLTAYAPGAVSYRWLCDGKPIVGGADGELTVPWLNGGTKTDDGFHLHSYQAIAVFNLYGAERESEPSAAADVKSRPLGLCVIIR